MVQKDYNTIVGVAAEVGLFDLISRLFFASLLIKIRTWGKQLQVDLF